jgi:hypothetical protein
MASSQVHPDRIDSTGREAVRASLLGQIPSWYSPWLHLIVPGLVGLAVVSAALTQVHAPRLTDLLAVPIVWVISNIFEWHIHRDVLHRRVPPLAELYERHTPQHHRVFITEDMAIRSWREFRLVLIPAVGVIGIVLLDGGFTAIVALVGGRNVAALYLATAVSYTLSYEWLHLCYHLPEQSWLGRRPLIRWLRRHHAIHHAPELMQRWNFNVTVPLWDWVRGTIHRDQESDTRQLKHDMPVP